MDAVVGMSAGWLQLRNLLEASWGTAETILRNWYDDANSSSSHFTDFVLKNKSLTKGFWFAVMRINFHIEQATLYHKIKIPGKSHIKIPAGAKNDMTVFFLRCGSLVWTPNLQISSLIRN